MNKDEAVQKKQAAKVGDSTEELLDLGIAIFVCVKNSKVKSYSFFGINSDDKIQVKRSEVVYKFGSLETLLRFPECRESRLRLT